MAFSQYKRLFRTSRTCYRRFLSSANERSGSASVTNAFVKMQQNEIFNEECARQMKLITRIEKIQVKVKGPEQDTTLIMNKGLSTPFNCAMHISEQLQKIPAIAFVNGQEWDIHSPLTKDCELSFMHFHSEDPRIANKAYWRSCSFLLGYVAEKAFKDDYYVELHSWPPPNVLSGSFVYDVDLKMGKWEPNQNELNVMSLMGRKDWLKGLKFERLKVDASVALKIFAKNRFKLDQIPRIAGSSLNGKDVILYRLGDHIDMSCGPMIANSNQVGRFDITAVYPIETDYGILHRFQGVSLPSQIKLASLPYKILLERARKVNPAQLPQKTYVEAGYGTPRHRLDSISLSAPTP